MLEEKKFEILGNPTGARRVSVGEGQHRRLSESVPPRHHTPPPREAGGMDTPRSIPPASKRQLEAVAATVPTRRCRRCRTARPADSFLLWDHPTFKGTAGHDSNAARHWCDACLDRSSFAKHPAVKQALAARDAARAATAAADEAAAHLRASGVLALRLYDKAAADPAFASALRLAASALDAPRADLEAVI